MSECQVRGCDTEASYSIVFDCDALDVVVALCVAHERELMHGGDPYLDEPRRLSVLEGGDVRAPRRPRTGRTSMAGLADSNQRYRRYDGTPIPQADASYVLDWLRQTDAPPNIIALQERAVEALGGFVGFEDRTKP